MSRLLANGTDQITQSYAEHKGWSKGIDIVKYKSQLDWITAHTDGKVIKVVDYLDGTNQKLDNEGMGYGNYVMILHDNNVTTTYAHMEKVQVKEGQQIKKGDKVGFMGNTGNSYGGHLHWEIRQFHDTPNNATLHDTTKFDWINPESYTDRDLPNQSAFKPIWNGLDYSPVFDADYYINKYSDLKKAFGNASVQELFNHFCTYGMKEHRQAIDTFNVDIYKNNYEDLQKAFGEDIVKYYQHYCEYGYKEHRIADKNIKVTLNANSYPSYSAGKYYRVQKAYKQYGVGQSIGAFQSWSLAYSNWNKHKEEGFHIFADNGARLD